MKGKTKIEWCDYTINCFWGCNNGCSYCQARSLARRFGKKIGTRRGYDVETIRKMSAFEPVFLRDQLYRVSEIKKPSRIFMSFQGEPFSPEFEKDLPEAFTVMRYHPEHTFMMLTKKPENLKKWSPFPENCWVGFSATTDNQLQYGLAHIAEVEATIKYISFEPLLEKMSFLAARMIDWVIIGRQTPPSTKTEPRIEWIQEIVEACDEAGVPVFLKDNLKTLNMNYACFYTGYPNKWRQEFPKE